MSRFWDSELKARATASTPDYKITCKWYAKRKLNFNLHPEVELETTEDTRQKVWGYKVSGEYGLKL